MRYLVLVILTLNVTLVSAQSQPFSLSLFFDKGIADLSPDNIRQIDEIRDMVKDSSYNAVFIKGYADNDGSDEFNLALSQSRVDAVSYNFSGRKYAVESKCYGEKEAINKNRNENEKSMNRRVDVIFWTNYAFGKTKKPPQVFTVSPNKPFVVTGAEGTKIKIPANALVYADGKTPLGDIQIELTEYYSMADILQNKLTTASNGQLLISDGMINITASRNNNALRLKGGELMEVQFTEREKDDGFGLFYGKEDPRSQTVNWVPAADPASIDKRWVIGGAKLWEADTVEKWRSKFEFNHLGQRIKVTERWAESKGKSYDTLIIDKTINTNNIILQATQLGWVNCDQFYKNDGPLVDLVVHTGADIESNIVMVFNDRKAMIAPVKTGPGQLVFEGVPAAEKVTITGVGAGEGKLYFAKQQVPGGTTYIELQLQEASIQTITEGLSSFK